MAKSEIKEVICVGGVSFGSNSLFVSLNSPAGRTPSAIKALPKYSFMRNSSVIFVVVAVGRIINEPAEQQTVITYLSLPIRQSGTPHARLLNKFEAKLRERTIHPERATFAERTRNNERF